MEIANALVVLECTAEQIDVQRPITYCNKHPDITHVTTQHTYSTSLNSTLLQMILPELQQWLQTQTVYPKYPTELPDSSREFYGLPSREFILLESSNKLIVHYNATAKLIAPILGNSTWPHEVNGICILYYVLMFSMSLGLWTLLESSKCQNLLGHRQSLHCSTLVDFRCCCLGCLGGHRTPVLSICDSSDTRVLAWCSLRTPRSPWCSCDCTTIMPVKSCLALVGGPWGTLLTKSKSLSSIIDLATSPSGHLQEMKTKCLDCDNGETRYLCHIHSAYTVLHISSILERIQTILGCCVRIGVLTSKFRSW